jgi:hypothetical protein
LVERPLEIASVSVLIRESDSVLGAGRFKGMAGKKGKYKRSEGSCWRRRTRRNGFRDGEQVVLGDATMCVE